jgi:glutaredoxin
MISLRYRLASNKVQKIDCLHCGAKKHWQRYIDIETGEVLPENHGRCDNSDKCGKWIRPKETGYSKTIWEQENVNIIEGKDKIYQNSIKRKVNNPTEPIYFDFETFQYTLERERYQKNVFIQNLLNSVSFPFEKIEVEKVVHFYKLGTIINGYRSGAITFPFIDLKGNVKAVQVKQFDEKNHTIGTDFLHSIIEKHHSRKNNPLPEWLKAYKMQDKLISCLFGEHLLSIYRDNPVALVEAPKTAIYGAMYFGLPESSDCLIWLAVYNKSSFSLDKLKVLEGRKVIVFPDLSKNGDTYNEWQAKAKQFEKQLKNTCFIFSDLLENYASNDERNNGLDIADFLIKQDWRLFRRNYSNLSKTQFVEDSEKELSTTFEELLKMAKEIIGFNNSKEKTDIPHFEKMLEYKIIKESKPILGQYYLADSTPF